MYSGGKTSPKSKKQMKKNNNIAENEPCATEICEEQKQIFIQLRASAWAEKSAEDHETRAQVYRERQDVVQKMRDLRQHMETIQFREKAFLLYCIDLMEEVLAKGNREMLETVADCMHNMPEVGMAEPKYRDLSTFEWEIQKIRAVYNEQCFADALHRIEKQKWQKRLHKMGSICLWSPWKIFIGAVLWSWFWFFGVGIWGFGIDRIPEWIMNVGTIPAGLAMFLMPMVGVVGLIMGIAKHKERGAVRCILLSMLNIVGTVLFLQWMMYAAIHF